MKRFTAILAALLIVVAVFLIGTLVVDYQRAYAATPVSGAITAKSGSGVTRNLFVYLSAAGTIDLCSAVTDSVIGVCEANASASAITRYAPVGTRANVLPGEPVAVGEMLTAGTGGRAFVLDTDDASTQRVCAIALTADADANATSTDTIEVILVASSSEQRLALASATIGGGFGDTGVSISAAGVIEANGAITTDGALTADNVVCTNAATFGGGFGDTGVTISTAGAIDANDAITTDGALTADNIVCTNAATFGGGFGDTGVSISTAGVIEANGAITSDGALTADSAVIGGGYGATGVSISAAGVIEANGAITSDGALTGASLNDANVIIAAGVVTGLTLDANNTNNTITNVPPEAASVVVEDTTAALAMLFYVDADADGTTALIAPCDLRIADAWVAQCGASADANATVTVSNVGNAITDAIALNHGDNDITRAATLDEAYQDVASGAEIRAIVVLVDVASVRVWILAVPR